MIGGLGWPDLLIGVILLIGLAKGFSRGFVSELGGAVAVVAALITPWYYNGAFDPWLEKNAHLGTGPAHVAGMFLTGIITYVVVIAASWVLTGIAKLPVLNVGNALGGAAIGLLKGAFLVWLVLFIALYFPLSREIRKDLHESKLAPFFTQENHTIDGAIVATVPVFARRFLEPYVARHHV
jgi:membrane protein required for colicin V production